MLYLAYGSNMSHRRIEARLGSCVRLGVGWLDGCQLAFHKRGPDGSGKCNAYLTGDDSDRLYGVVFGLREAQGHILDRYEGPGYYRRYFALSMVGGIRYAFAYVGREAYIDSTFPPYDWYLNFAITGAKEGGVPIPYIRRLEARPCITDPDLARRDKSRAILAGESKDSL